MPRPTLLLSLAAAVIVVGAIAQVPRPTGIPRPTAGQTATPKPQRPGVPGSWINLKNVYVPGEQIPLGDPVPIQTADEKNFDPDRFKVFIKKTGAEDMWELSPILMSGWTYDIPKPAGARQITVPTARDEDDENTKYGPRAVVVACTAPQLPRGTYEVWYEKNGVKGPVKNIGMFPKLSYTLQGHPYEGRNLTLTVEVVGPTRVPPKVGAPVSPAPGEAAERGVQQIPRINLQGLAGKKADDPDVKLGVKTGFHDRLRLAGTSFQVPVTIKAITDDTPASEVVTLAEGKAPMTVTTDLHGDAEFDLKAVKRGKAQIAVEAQGFPPLNVEIPVQFTLKLDLSGYFTGFADLHAHYMSHLGFNGSFVGKPYSEDGLSSALKSCEYRHGLGGIVPNLESGDSPTHATGGYPEFDGWPRFTSKSHQTAYVKWIERAYRQGNLRLACMLAVNNELVGRISSQLTPGIPKTRPYDDKKLVDAQIKGMWDMVAFVDKENGGQGKGWMQIALSPEDARRIIKEGKMAIVLGIECDSLGNWRTPQDLQKESGNDPNKARALIRAELKRLYNRGVRQIAPIHLTDNAFGGCAVYNKIFTALDKYVTGHFYEVENATNSGVYYNVRRDEFPFAVNALLTLFASDATDGFGKWENSVSTSGGTANTRGLTRYGEMVIEEMMDLGMIIDMDHFSQKSLSQAMAITEKRAAAKESRYPFVFSHVAFRDLALDPSQTSEVKQTANEGHKTAAEIERLKASGGMVGVGLVQGNLKSFGTRVPNDSAGSSKSWAQAYQYAVAKLGTLGVGMGTDVNGGPGAPTPRFGSFASEALHPKIGSRGAARRAQAESQTAGVRYDGKWKDYRRYRFDEDDGVYDDEEREIWEGLALAKSGVDIDDADVNYWNRAIWDSDEVRYFARGFRLAKTTKDEDKWETRAAWLAKTGGTPLQSESSDVHRYFKKARRVWNRWVAMESGPNPPMKRSLAGRRDFDINIDGVAHYGLLADFIQDLKNVGMTDKDLTPLMSSACGYVTMWEKCERMKK